MYSGELEVQAKRKALAVLQDEITRILNSSRDLSTLTTSLMKGDDKDIQHCLERMRNTEEEVENLRRKITREVAEIGSLMANSEDILRTAYIIDDIAGYISGVAFRLANMKPSTLKKASFDDDLKQLVAYSSIGHMGFVALAIATMSQTGIIAAVFGSVAHGLITGLLFFLAGSLKERYGTASLAALGRGLYGRAPWRAVALLVAGLATVGLPGLAGFWGEFLTLRAAYEPASLLPQTFSIVLMAIATFGIVLATAYVARFARVLLQGVPTRLDLDRDIVRREGLVVVALLLPIVVLGLFPGLIFDLFPPIGYAP